MKKESKAPTILETKAIEAMEKIIHNQYTLQPGEFCVHGFGYMTTFNISNGDKYLVKVCDEGPCEVFKRI